MMTNEYSYGEYQNTCALYGFTYTPLSEAEFDLLTARGCDDNTIYIVGCDVAADVPFTECLESI